MVEPPLLQPRVSRTRAMPAGDLRSSNPQARERTSRSPSARSCGVGPAKSACSAAAAGASLADRPRARRRSTARRRSRRHRCRPARPCGWWWGTRRATSTTTRSGFCSFVDRVRRALLHAQAEGDRALEVARIDRRDHVGQRVGRPGLGRGAVLVVAGGPVEHHRQDLRAGHAHGQPRAVVVQGVDPLEVDVGRQPVGEAERHPVDLPHVLGLHRGQRRQHDPAGRRGRGWRGEQEQTEPEDGDHRREPRGPERS